MDLLVLVHYQLAVLKTRIYIYRYLLNLIKLQLLQLTNDNSHSVKVLISNYK